MAAETVAWFLFGGDRDDFIWEPMLQPLSGPQYLRLLVNVRRNGA